MSNKKDKTIGEVDLIEELNDDVKLPVSDGSAIPKTTNVKQLKEYVGKGASGGGFYNVTTNIPLPSGNYTKSLAVQAVAENANIPDKSKYGMIITFWTGTEWKVYRYDSPTLDGFASPENWNLFGESAETSYILRLETNSQQSIEATNRDISINLRFISLVYNPIDQSQTDTGEDATLTIERRMEGDSSWTRVGIIEGFPSVSAGGAYRTVNLSQYLLNGTQSIRIKAEGQLTQTNTSYALFDVLVAEMNVEYAANWGQAFVYNADVTSTHTINIPLRITGNVYKFLNWELYNPQGTLTNSGSLEVGAAEYTESYYAGLQITHPQAVGIYKVRVMLQYGNSALVTAWKELNIMVSVKDDTTVLLCVNNVTPNVFNWSSQHLMDYAVYNPTTQLASTVRFDIMDSEETVTWMTNSNSNVEDGVVYDYTPYLSIENSTPSGRVRLFAAKVKVSVEDVLKQTLTYNVDNSNDFAPTSGANFILAPNSRSNSDVDKEVIHNESSVAGEPTTIPAVWENVVFENDGWISEGDVKALLILAGGKVTIPYESYSNTSQANGLTIEVDLKTKNVSDEDAPILKMGKEINGHFVGLIFYPKRGYFFKSTNNVEWFQDIEWGENIRTHLAVNIIPNLTIGGRAVNLVRMTVNANINREFTYLLTDRFWDGNSSGGIQIGSTGADTYIYGMRIFKEKILSSSDLFNDRVSSISDVSSKLALIEANNIMEGGVIKYNLAKTKYNTLVWKGVYPSKLNQVETTGDLDINIIGDLAHSGTLYGMKCKGQGTSSKRYLYWNATWSFGDDGVWVDGLGNSKGKYHQLTSTSPKAKKNVGKLNWASSPQSHKMGMCNMINVLYDTIFDGSAGFEPSGIRRIQGYERTRIAVEEKAFLFFVQESPDSEPVFYGNMTWGSAKGDAPTFGYDKNHPILKDYLMIEGSDQTPVLGLCQVPWFDDEVLPHYDDKGELDGWQYNGTLSFDATLGNTASISHFKEAFNQCFYYSTRINYYNGRLADLQSDQKADKSYQYFIVGQTFDNFYVYRYDWINGLWVNAGITKTNGTPDAVNVNTQLGLDLDPTSADFEGMLARVKAARCAAFRAIAGNHFHINDTLFGMQFNKLNALSDNRNKNTYPYYDPVDGVIRFGSDDNDTCLPNNNQGQKQKPYWVEEHDFDSRPNFNSYFWAASGNAMYNLFEDAYPTELRTMMRRILTAMNNLGVGYGEGGIMGFYEKYLFSIQRYFPTVAYNECARLWYETAKTLYDAGIYTNDTDPITQSLGDLLECEMDWVRKRIVYIASYCMYDAAMGGSIEYRQLNTATYRLTPAMKMYVYMELGTSSRFPIGYNVPKRCEAGETVEIICEGSDSIQTYIVGAEYLADLGDLAPVGVTGATAFANGKRLTRLKLGDATASVVRFKPNAVTSFPANASVIDLRNMGDTLTSIGSLADVTKLQEFYCSGTGIQALILPQTNNITKLVLNEALQSLILRNQQNVSTFNFTPTNLTTLVSGNCNVIDQQFITDWLSLLDGDLSGYSLEIDNIRWTGYAATQLMKLIGFGHLILKGRITLDSNSISAEQLAAVYAKLGSLIDRGDLELVYTNVINLTMTKTSITGGDEASFSDFTASALNANPLSLLYSEDGTTWRPISENPRLTLTNSRTEVINGCRYLYGRLSADTEVESAVQYRLKVTDGTQSSLSIFFSITARNRITAVSVSGTKYLTETNHGYPFTAALTPNNASEVPTYNWIIESVGDSDTYEVEVGETYSRVIRRVDGIIMVELPNTNTANVTLMTGGELMAAKNNNTSFTVRCTVRGTYGSEVSSTYEVIGHALFTPKAVQSYDPAEENYNPALIIYLKNNEATTGVTLHAYESGKGYYMTQAEAAAVTTLGTINGLTQIQDVDGVVVESWDGDVNTQPYYRFEDFDQFKYFTRFTSLPGCANCINLKYLSIHPNCTTIGNAFVPSSLIRVKFEEGHTGMSGTWNSVWGNIPANQLTIYIPSTWNPTSNQTQQDPFTSKVANVYYNGTIQQWLNGKKYNNYDSTVIMANRSFTNGFNLYCKGQLITEISANDYNSASYKENIGRCASLITINGEINSLGSYRFINCSNLENITLSPDITSIPEYCFYGCSKLNLTEIPNNITSIGADALSGTACSFSVIPDSVTSFGQQSNMPNITDISYPNTMTAPGGFANCANLRSVFFRKGDEEDFVITTLPNFYTNNNLKKIGYKGNFVDNTIVTPPSITSIVATEAMYSNTSIINYCFKGITNSPSMDRWANNFNIQFISLLGIINLNNNNNEFFRDHNKTYLIIGKNAVNIKVKGINGNRGVINNFVYSNTPANISITGFMLQKNYTPINSKTLYIQASVWNGLHLIEYDYTNDPANIITAIQASDIIATGIPLTNCAISINNGTATITCVDPTFTSAIPIKLHYRINGSAWSSPVNSGATFAVSANDVIEVYATHSLRAPSNMLKATYDGTNITYDYTDIYIAPDDVDSNGNLI